MEIVSVYCKNKSCSTKKFTLHPKWVDKHQRATKRLQREAIDENVLDNIPLRTLEKKFKRIFNTSGSRYSINRLKHQQADQIEFRNIAPLLGFSGILCIDEFKPKGSRKFNLMASDFKTNRIIFAMKVARRDEYYSVMFLKKLKNWGINPYLVMVDRLAAFSTATRQVFPKAIIQYDYYHVITDIYDYLKKALKSYVEELKQRGKEEEAKLLNKQRFLIIKKKINMKRREKQFSPSCARNFLKP